MAAGIYQSVISYDEADRTSDGYARDVTGATGDYEPAGYGAETRTGPNPENPRRTILD